VGSALERCGFETLNGRWVCRDLMLVQSKCYKHYTTKPTNQSICFFKFWNQSSRCPACTGMVGCNRASRLAGMAGTLTRLTATASEKLRIQHDFAT
jgi:hypothetical protein